MESVAFISTETGTDLVVAFALNAAGAPEEIESLILMRTPKFEVFLEERERGIRVYSERLGEEESEGLEDVVYREADSIVTLKTAAHTYIVDVHRVDRGRITAMRKLLRRMNFDRRVQMSGI
jgi:hypothetical protein